MTKSRFPLERLVWATLLFIAIGAALFFARFAGMMQGKFLWEKMRSRSLTVDKQSLVAQLETARAAIPPAEIAALKRKGLTHPITQLRAALLKYPPRIPQQGVLGGTMGFHDADDIRFLGDGWVFAGFDDGHITGKALLRYEVSEGGKISWKLVGSVLD